MNINIKQSALVAAVTAALAIGASGQASAAIYGGAAVNVQGLTVAIFEITTGTLATINSFDFRTTTLSDLNGVNGPTNTATCTQAGGCGGPAAWHGVPTRPGRCGRCSGPGFAAHAGGARSRARGRAPLRCRRWARPVW